MAGTLKPKRRLELSQTGHTSVHCDRGSCALGVSELLRWGPGIERRARARCVEQQQFWREARSEERPKNSSRATHPGWPAIMEAKRLSQLKTQLSRLRYDQPLGIESAPLVERLLDDLTKSNERQTELAALAEKRANEIAVAEQHVLPVRKENTRLVRENNELHMQIIADAEAAEAA